MPEKDKHYYIDAANFMIFQPHLSWNVMFNKIIFIGFQLLCNFHSSKMTKLANLKIG